MKGNSYHIRLIIEGKVEDKRCIGRRKLSWLRNIRSWTGLGAEHRFRVANDRKRVNEIVMVTPNGSLAPEEDVILGSLRLLRTQENQTQ